MIETFPVKLFEKERNVSVYLPDHYNQHEWKRYPVIYMHDGQNVFKDEDAIGGVSLSLEEYLIKNQLDVIVVAIDQNSEERINEYCPWINGKYTEKLLGYPCELGGKGERYIDFITNELKPLIDGKYRTLKENTVMAGISLGGLISIYAACKYPDIYKHIVAFSSAFYRNQEQMEELIISSDLSSIESIYLDWGAKEVEDEKISTGFAASNQTVSDLLNEKVANFKWKVIHEGKHTYLSFKERVPAIFSFLEANKNIN